MMKKVFVSVPNKLLLLIIGILLLVTSGFSYISLTRLNQEFKQFQQETTRYGQSQFELHHEILQAQIRVWLESFSDLTYLREHSNFDGIANGLKQQFNALELNYNVENVWLFDSHENLLYGSTLAPEYLKAAKATVRETHAPVQQLICEQYCLQLVVLPLLNKSGEVAVVAVTASLVDMIYSINQALKSEVGVVSFDNNASTLVKDVHFISSSNVTLFSQLFSSQQAKVQMSQVKAQGLLIDQDSASYLINLLPLSSNNKNDFYLVLIDDVSSIKVENQEYREQFLASALFIFMSFLLMFYFIARPLSQRLIVLSEALPFLAKREFDKFRKVELKRRNVFSDELDFLSSSALELSYELEQMDIEIEQKTKELENIAMFDILTGLPNRNMLNFQLRELVKHIDDMSGGIAVLFLDLDDFKKVNDSHGHNEGDNLLIEASNRIRSGIGEQDLVFRFGGDEFVVVLHHISSEKEAINVALEILEHFKRPIKIESNIFYVSASIGIAFSTTSENKGDDLISFADIAMYEAKANGGAQFYIHHNEMYQKVAHRVKLEGEVRQALAKQQFSLSLQPQITAKDKKVFGFEALLRWQHPERGMVPPDDFIPILENSEHMIELGYWIIRHCFEIMIDLRKSGMTDCRIAINLTAGQFNDPNLPHYLLGLLDEFSLPASCFELELTEQTLVKDIDHTIEMMEMLKSIGFSFAIDDFGTGYSSLAYLKEMPVDVIKIDKSFVFGMLENKADYQIIMSTIAMVKRLGLLVVAEGVESSAQLRSLTHNECDLIQGYYFSKPIPEAELLAFIDGHIIDGYWKTQVKVAG